MSEEEIVDQDKVEEQWTKMLRTAPDLVKAEIIEMASEAITPQGMTPLDYGYVTGIRDKFIRLRQLMEN